MIEEEKKRVRLIHNKILVSGPPETLLPHEVLVREDPNSNKVSLQEIDSNGNLSTISVSSEESNTEDIKYNYIRLCQYWRTTDYYNIRYKKIKVPLDGVVGLLPTVKDGKYIAVLPQHDPGREIFKDKGLSIFQKIVDDNDTTTEIKEVARIETKDFSISSYPCPIIIIEIVDPIRPEHVGGPNYSKCKAYPADPDKDYYISNLKCTIRYDSKTRDLIINTDPLPIRGQLPIRRFKYLTHNVQNVIDVHVISRKAQKLKSNK